MRLLHLRHDHERRRAAAAKVPIPPTPKSSNPMQGNICRCGTYPRIIAAVPGRPTAIGPEPAHEYCAQAPRNTASNPVIEPERYEFSAPPAHHFHLARRDFFKAPRRWLCCLCLREIAAASAQETPASCSWLPATKIFPRTSLPGCTSAKTARSPFSPAKSKSARTSALPSPRQLPKNSASRSFGPHRHGRHATHSL